MTGLEVLLAARRDPANRPAHLPDPPADVAAAYALQHAVMANLGSVGGWKVGSPRPDGPFTCAPLPACFVVPGPADVPEDECPDRGVEAEIAVRIGRDLPPRGTPYAAEEVLAAVASAHPAIELLQSRFRDAEAAGPLSMLADSLSHFGLVWGEAVPDWQAVAFDAEGVRVLADGREIKRGRGNPGGDMPRLLVWLANEGAAWAGGLRAGQVVTTGSWTGKDFVAAGAAVRVEFDRCGTVEARFR